MPMPVAERVLLARVAGPFARCPSSLRTILGAIESPRPRWSLHAEMCDSWGAGGVARCAGATRVRPAGVARRVIFRRSRVHISGPHVAPGVILGGSDTSGRCFVAWYGRESAVPRFIYP